MAAPSTILILEASATRLVMYRSALGADHTLLFAQTPVDALTLLAQRRPDLVVLGARIAGGPAAPAAPAGRLDAVDICRIIKRSPAGTTPVILCAGDAGPLAALRARRAGADRFLPNPVEAQTLRRAIDELLSPGIIAARLRPHDFIWTRTPRHEQTHAASAL